MIYDQHLMIICQLHSTCHDMIYRELLEAKQGFAACQLWGKHCKGDRIQLALKEMIMMIMTRLKEMIMMITRLGSF